MQRELDFEQEKKTENNTVYLKEGTIKSHTNKAIRIYSSLRGHDEEGHSFTAILATAIISPLWSGFQRNFHQIDPLDRIPLERNPLEPTFLERKLMKVLLNSFYHPVRIVKG